ncbi:hypothetical protein AGABI1DRAFT_48372 [Agaricus bisporus var. burnettii JB137-S8]|nr:uncharacterized protein AGABI1DRAFT_48372 [Agaricus bisporus var. burnettii JB137-S8]EKM74235.1 hypothetical protein AGABI1DRAFT_48372 [Agaricus bisporus var. burnettii JB137-S8]
MFNIDISKLSYDVNEDESIILEDGDGPFLVVIRNACKRLDVVSFVDDIIKEVVDSRTNIRKEDPGHMSQMGWSAGSRSSGILDWVRNVRRQKTSIAQHCEMNYRASSAFAVLWSLSRTLLPEFVLDDLKEFMLEIGNGMRMDGNGMMKCDSKGRGQYMITIQGVDYVFSGAMAELAPPAGVVAENYCRYIHKEKQPHEWAISLTTSRTFDSAYASEQAGGHFYVASHGVRVQAKENTLISWRPKDWHGTSLLLVDPMNKNKEYHQRGLSFVTSSRLPSAIEAHKAGLLSDAQLESVATAPEEVESNEES